MIVNYQDTLSLIEEAIYNSKKDNRPIDNIILSPDEWYDLCRSVNKLMPANPIISYGASTATFAGVTIEKGK